MTQEHQITFGPFRLERPQGRLWRGDHLIPLRPRSLALLHYLAAHAGRLVTKAEVQAQVWGGTHVTPNVQRVCVREIRAALGDAAGAPRYLETVGGQGYRFLVGWELAGPLALAAGPLVGRQGEVAALEGWYQQAAQGTRQFVFISGEAGVGKTTVVEMFRRHLAAGGRVWTARGQCVEHAGEGEPYLPFVEALGQLGQGPERDTVRAVLRRYAPLWLVQLPGLVSEPELERLQGRLHGTTPARMLRELAEALEVLTADRVLVLLLEDLQWSDPSTVEALAYLAQRRDPAQLLVLGTYRPVNVALVCQFRRDVAATQAHVDALLAVATAHRLAFRAEQGRLLQGWTLAMQGEAAAGVAHLRQALASPDMGPESLRPYGLATLAEVYGRAGQPQAGLQVLAEAMTLIATTEVRWWEAEVYRLQGALLLQLPSPDVPQAEAAFLRALEVARRQQAKALELRTALSLARLWQRQGQPTAARQLLAEIYSWFTEGFDTADLQEAKAVLAELGAEGGLSAEPLARWPGECRMGSRH